MFGRSCLHLLVFVLIGTAAIAPAQSDRARPGVEFVRPSKQPIPLPPFRGPISVSPASFRFPQLVRAAGIIFSGAVTAIKRNPSSSSQPVETVSITFHVENAIRGTTPGDRLTIKQWMGLWTSGQRYRVGERMVLFLYAPSKIGLTSSVGDALGRFRIEPTGLVSLSPQQISAFQQDPVLGGKSPVRLSDFALAVRQAREEE